MPAKQSTRARTRISRNRRNIAALDIVTRVERGDGSLEDMAVLADALEVPLWVLLIPGIAGPDIDTHVRTIQAMVESYVARTVERRAAS